jgi:hypothetical protein
MKGLLLAGGMGNRETGEVDSDEAGDRAADHSGRVPGHVVIDRQVLMASFMIHGFDDGVPFAIHHHDVHGEFGAMAFRGRPT